MQLVRILTATGTYLQIVEEDSRSGEAKLFFELGSRRDLIQLMCHGELSFVFWYQTFGVSRNFCKNQGSALSRAYYVHLFKHSLCAALRSRAAQFRERKESAEINARFASFWSFSTFLGSLESPRWALLSGLMREIIPSSQNLLLEAKEVNMDNFKMCARRCPIIFRLGDRVFWDRGI